MFKVKIVKSVKFSVCNEVHSLIQQSALLIIIFGMCMGTAVVMLLCGGYRYCVFPQLVVITAVGHEDDITAVCLEQVSSRGSIFWCPKSRPNGK